jgi:hypothetical protein
MTQTGRDVQQFPNLSTSNESGDPNGTSNNAEIMATQSQTILVMSAIPHFLSDQQLPKPNGELTNIYLNMASGIPDQVIKHGNIRFVSHSTVLGKLSGIILMLSIVGNYVNYK